MVNGDNLRTKLKIESKHNELTNEVQEIEDEIKDLQELRNNIFETLNKLDAKIIYKENKLNLISDELRQVDLCSELLYNSLNCLGKTYISDIELSDKYKKFLESHGCKIEKDENEPNKYKIKRIILEEYK